MTYTLTGALHTTPAIQQVLCWRSVCVLYVLLCVLLLPELVNSSRPRCGVELIADLEFVCGDRGFYRGHGSSVRSAGPRSRGKGIVEQCCIKGCDLQHLERYCANPKRERRHLAPAPEQVMEDQFWLVFYRRYERNLFKNEQQKFLRRLKERMTYREKRRGAQGASLVNRKRHKLSRNHRHHRKWSD